MDKSRKRHGALALSLIAAGVVQQVSANDPEALQDDRWYVLPMGSYVVADDARSTDDGYGAVLAIGKRVSAHLELELRGQYLQYDAEDRRRRLLGIPIGPEPQNVEIGAGGIGASLFLSPSGRGLYLHADAMAGDTTLYNIGGGFDFAVGTDVSLRVEALYHIDDDADVEEPQFNLGLRIPLGARAQPLKPEPVRVVPPIPAAPPPKSQCSDGIDNDGDGLIDYPEDPGCSSPSDDDESNPRCELPTFGQTVDLSGCAVGDSLVLHGVNFEFDKATLTVDAKTQLDQVADALLRRPDIKVEVAGHTDSKGSDAYNQRLSEARARAVVEHLASRGVDPARMRAAGYGESIPVAGNATDEGRALNRRVELKVLESSNGVRASIPQPRSAPVPSFDSTVAPTLTTEPAPLPTATPSPTSTPTSAEAAAPVASATAAVSAPAVGMAGHQFTPATLTVSAGTTVVWTNDDGSTHVVSFADTESGRLRAGDTYSRRFDQPGAYPYDCALHPMMRGTIVVE